MRGALNSDLGFRRASHKENCRRIAELAIEVCRQRDLKGLYAKVQRAELANFTGIDDVYEVPRETHFVISTAQQTVADSTAELVQHIISRTAGG